MDDCEEGNKERHKKINEKENETHSRAENEE